MKFAHRAILTVLMIVATVFVSSALCAATPKIFVITGGVDAQPIKTLLESWQASVTVHDLDQGPIPAQVLFDHVKNLTVVALAPHRALSGDDQNMILDYLTSRGNALFFGSTFLEDHDNTDFLNYYLLTKVATAIELPTPTTLMAKAGLDWPSLTVPAGTVRACIANDPQGQVLWDIPSIENASAGLALRGKT